MNKILQIDDGFNIKKSKKKNGGTSPSKAL